jgi:hypothetical protein
MSYSIDAFRSAFPPCQRYANSRAPSATRNALLPGESSTIQNGGTSRFLVNSFPFSALLTSSSAEDDPMSTESWTFEADEFTPGIYIIRNTRTNEILGANEHNQIFAQNTVHVR